jgi:anti-sigma regulatory factor (Ser/Thr protein kinase)
MEHAGFRHRALIYEGADEYLAGVTPFLQAALEAEEPAMVAVRRERVQLLEGALGADARRLRFVAMEEVGRNPASAVPLWRDFVEENQGRSVRGASELVWPERGAAGREECHRCEALLNIVFAGQSGFSLLCPYDASSLPDEELETAATSHSCISREGRTEPSAAFDPGRDWLSGELPPPAARPENISFDLRDLSEVRRAVAAAAERAGMDPRGVADLVTATSELAANSIMHGGGAGTLRLWRDGDSLLAEVEDRGRIEEPLVGCLRPGIHQEGGRGLWLANRLCDLVQIRSGAGGTVVRLHVPAHDHASSEACGLSLPGS